MHGLGDSTQTKQRINDKMQSYYLKWLPNLRGSLLYCELQCGLSQSAADWDRSKVYTSCETSRLTPEVHSHLFLYGFKAMTLERSGLNGGKASDWLRPFQAQWWESLWLAETLPHDKRAVFDYFAPTIRTILNLSTVTQSMALLSLKVQRETNSCS